MGQFIDPDDLVPFADIPAAKAAAMVADAEAKAVLTAPCIADLAADDPKRAAVRATLRAAILRWHDAGSGVVQQTQVGPFGQSIDTRQARKTMFWPSEIEELQGICRGPAGRAFETDTMPAGSMDGYWSAPDTWVPLTGGS